MTRLYPLDRSPCVHPPLDDFKVRGIARLCDVCLLRLHELAVGPPRYEWITDVPNRFKLDVSRARCLAAVLGVDDPTLRELELLPVAASVVARCDDLLRVHAATWPPWLSGVYLERGATGDGVLDSLYDGARLASHEDCGELDALVDRIVEEASA